MPSTAQSVHPQAEVAGLRSFSGITGIPAFFACGSDGTADGEARIIHEFVGRIEQLVMLLELRSLRKRMNNVQGGGSAKRQLRCSGNGLRDLGPAYVNHPRQNAKTWGLAALVPSHISLSSTQ